MIETGASHRNELNDTCLHRAVMSKEYDIAKILIEHGWDPNAQDKNGHTPLDVAHSRHDELLSHLLEDRGALAKHHRRNMEKFKMHKDQHEREKRDHHDKFVHQHLHEHNEHGRQGIITGAKMRIRWTCRTSKNDQYTKTVHIFFKI